MGYDMANKMLYVPVIKTGDAELRGLSNLNEKVKDSIFPIIELTRSRSSKKAVRGNIYRRIDQLIQSFGNRPFIVDLTSIQELINEQIEALLNSENGYKNWVDFVYRLQSQDIKILPTIIVSEDINDSNELDKRLRVQVEKLAEKFEKVIYRFPISDLGYKNDLYAIHKTIDFRKNLICVLDSQFISQRKATVYSEKALATIRNLNNLGVSNIVLAATSFPNTSDFDNDFDGKQQDVFSLEEAKFFNLVQKGLNASDVKLIYGDYASINPIRNDQRGGRGWIPRIDFPTEDEVFYIRLRKGEGEYSEAYSKVAKRLIQDKRYSMIKKRVGTCWGIEQIELAAEGLPPKLSPSFWISVRMNIHITLRTAILKRSASSD